MIIAEEKKRMEYRKNRPNFNIHHVLLISMPRIKMKFQTINCRIRNDFKPNKI